MRVQFYNSVGGGGYWQRLLDEIAATGHSVSHRYALSDSAVRSDVCLRRRLARRWQMYPGYGLQILSGGADADVHVVSTNPFFAPALVHFLNGGRSHTIFLLYDLIPDGFELASLTKPNSVLSRLLARFTVYALQHCSATVFLGKRLLDHAEARYGPIRYPTIIPVGADGSMFHKFPPVETGVGQRIRILYCGNMGSAHEFETIEKFFERGLSDAGVEWHFHGFGNGYRNFLNGLSGNYDNSLCRFRGPLAADEWFSAMLSAHIALITMRPGAEKIVMPSKTYSALVAGQAILAICPRQSDLADLVYETDAGWVVEPGDVEGLCTTIAEVQDNPSLLQTKRENAFRVGHERYDMASIAKQWSELFEQIRAFPHNEYIRAGDKYP